MMLRHVLVIVPLTMAAVSCTPAIREDSMAAFGSAAGAIRDNAPGNPTNLTGWLYAAGIGLAAGITEFTRRRIKRARKAKKEANKAEKDAIRKSTRNTKSNT